MKKPNNNQDDDIRPEYDFGAMKGGVRGKYIERLRERSNIVLLEPDIAQAFPTEEAVNGALREVLRTPERRKERKPPRTAKRSAKRPRGAARNRRPR